MGRIEKYEIALTSDQNEVYEEAMASLKKYNQAAIHLYTSGGKSYILGKILERLDDNKLRTSPSGDRLSVLYCSKNGCCENAKRLFGGHRWENVIQYMTFCTLQHDTKAVDSLNVDKFDVIVIDEAHRALAKQTYKGINYILSKYPRASVIAMSANNKRNDDRKWVFEWLTPKLKVGVDYQNRGIKWAVQNNKICSYVYRNGDLDKLKRYTTLLTNIKDRESLNDYSELLNESMELLKKFSNNPFEIVEEQLKHDIDSIGYDGTNGDRWIVFFNRIDDIEKSADKIKGLFDKAYDGKGCNINIIKFHSKSTNEQEALEALTQKSVDKQVDVVLTCMKASSSFHPDNIRGIIVNRHSNSEIDVTQMFGRALQIKE